MSITTDVRNYADTAIAQGKTVLSQASTVVASANKRLIADAPKPAYAALGAADLVAATVTKRVETLPTETVQGVSKAQQTSRTLLNRTQSDARSRLQELRERLDASLDAVTALPEVAKHTTEAYLSSAKDLYGKLTVRGEAKAAELRKDPRLTKLLGQAGDVADSVQDSMAPVAKSAFEAVASVNPRETRPARITTARTASRTSPATKSSASKPAAKSTTAKRAPRKSTASKSTATKSTASKSTSRA